jgi:hypothetical protein
VTKIDAMFIHVFVCRANVAGAAPFTWEIRGAGATPIAVSVARFESMHAAYEAGKARLAELKRPLSTPTSGRSAVRRGRPRYNTNGRQDQPVAA